MYRTLTTHYEEKFGCKVYKLSLDAGFTCPNRDGTLSRGGCIFCSAEGSGEFAERSHCDLAMQLEKAKKRVEAKCPSGKYVAYLQAFTNTYGPIDRLEAVYTAAIAPDYIVGLAIGTRPDCLSEPVVSLLARINRIKPVSVELGLQTTNPKTALYIRRGYDNCVYTDAVARLKAAGIEVVTHIILGLPGETTEDMVNTTRDAVTAGTDGVKFHLLHVLKNTDLEKDYLAGNFPCLSLPQYAACIKACLQVLPAYVTVHRITGDGAKRSLVAPLWSADKKRVLNYLHHYLSE